MQSHLRNSRIIEATEHFPFNEFIVSETYPEIARQIDMTETDKMKFFYFGIILEQVRAYCGAIPIILTSGKRDIKLNTVVDGSDNTDHLYDGSCGAVDFTLSRDIDRLWRAYALLVYRLPASCGQVILYLYNSLNCPDFIHISLPTFYHDKTHWKEHWIMLGCKFFPLSGICKRSSKIESILWNHASDLRKEGLCR